MTNPCPGRFTLGNDQVTNAYGTHMQYREYLLDDHTDSECLLNDYNEALMQQSRKNCATNSRNAKYERGCNFCRKSFAALPEVKNSQKHGSLVADM